MGTEKSLAVLQPIHYVVWQSLPGGMESYITHYTERLLGQRELYIYSLRSCDNELNKRLDNRHFKKGSDNNWACYTGFFRYARKHRHDLFHLMNGGPIVLLLLLLAGARNPVYHIHGTKYWKTWKDRLYLTAAWRLVSLFNVRYVANSAYSAEVFMRDALPIRPTVVHNGFELSRFTEKRHLRTRLKRMAYIGRFDKDKNVDLVIRLFEEIAGEHPELELHIAGAYGTQEKQIAEQAGKSPYTDRIFFHGWVKDVAQFYQSMDLFVFLSAHESFGNVLAEALLTGLPILTSDVPVFNEIHGGEKAFCLGNPGNYPAIRERFLQVLTDFPALAQKSYDAADRIKALFDIEIHFNQINETYKNSNFR
jgi:glycosyltransferase involved in cell wall biosynthesis